MKHRKGLFRSLWVIAFGVVLLITSAFAHARD
jgi:hypothetical protein